ncbi:MAG TPA: SpoIIE family protein phosphatase [Chthoniobacterales bacterium]
MRFSLRAKILSLAALAGVLSLLAAVVVIWSIGYRQRVVEQGSRFQSEAGHVANTLHLLVDQEISSLEELLVLGNIAGDLSRIAPGSNAGVDVARLDKAWANLPLSAPEISTVLQNDLSVALRRFQSTNPSFAEILVTDEHGRLIAATGKASDYDQSDEDWWRQAMALRAGRALLTGLDYDESAGVFSLDISIPIPSANAGSPSGVMKAVLNISPIFASIPVFSPQSGVTSSVVRPDGDILLRASEHAPQPSGDRILPKAMEQLQSASSGWFVGPLRDNVTKMVGFASVHLSGIVNAEGAAQGPAIYLVIEEPARALLRPVLQRTLITLGVGSIFIIGCVLTGVWLIQRNLLTPIEILRTAAAAITTTASRPAVQSTPILQDSFRRISTIRTRDEMQELAQDFSTMAGRLLNYQSDLRREIGTKTAEIQRDLDLARDFQQAFLPHAYPRVPAVSAPGALSLNFCHIYQAASTVGGDFLDVVQLNDHCAGVLIADVMGHGTRSALVTAILRTILHGLATRTEDPAQFLGLLNQRFHDILKETDELIFVSVCYVILDTQAQTVRCASAGHPSPLVANRGTRELTALFEILRHNPALGLYSDSQYEVFARPLRDGDVLLLFTDGVIEAMNPSDEDFGITRLEAAVRENLDADLPSLTKSLLDRVLAFTDTQPPTDDICLLAAEAVASVRVRTPSPDSR